MKPIRTVLLSSLALLAGCAMSSREYPARWATIDEAFPSQDLRLPTSATQESHQNATFAASYEDVYRAALVSLGQVQYLVGREDKRGGIVAGTQVVSPEIRKHLAIVIQEKGPKRTEVTVLGKGQRKCIVTAMGPPEGASCRTMSDVHWGSAKFSTSAATDINQVLVFLRNNLVAAGVL